MIAFVKRKLKNSGSKRKQATRNSIGSAATLNPLFFDTLSLYRDGGSVTGIQTINCMPKFDFSRIKTVDFDPVLSIEQCKESIATADYGKLYKLVRRHSKIVDYSEELLGCMLSVPGDTEQHFTMAEILVKGGCDPFMISRKRRMSLISLALEMGKYHAFEGMISVPVGRGRHESTKFINFVSVALISDIENRLTFAVDICFKLRSKAEKIVSLKNKVPGVIDDETINFAEYVFDVFNPVHFVYGNMTPRELISMFPDDLPSIMLKRCYSE